LRIVFLACSSWVSNPYLGGVSIAIVRDSGFALLDCGPKAPERIALCGLDPCSLDFVLVTHMHGDHVLGLPTLIMWRRFRCPSKTTVVVGAKPVIDSVRKLLELVGCPQHREVELVPISVGEETEIMGYRLTLFEARHSIYSTVVRLCVEGSCIAYSSDTAPCSAIAEASRGCSVLIHEASGTDPELMHRIGHSTPLDAIEAAAASGVKRLVLMHPGLEPISVPMRFSDLTIVVPHACYEISS